MGQLELFPDEVTSLNTMKCVCKLCGTSFRAVWRNDLSLICENCQQNEPNPMRKTHGPGPDGAKCKTCKHLFAKRWDRTYYKCALRGNTNGAGTDHRVRWNACAKYEEDKE